MRVRRCILCSPRRQRRGGIEAVRMDATRSRVSTLPAAALKYVNRERLAFLLSKNREESGRVRPAAVCGRWRQRTAAKGRKAALAECPIELLAEANGIAVTG